MAGIHRLKATINLSTTGGGVRACVFIGTSARTNIKKLDSASGCGTGANPRTAIAKALRMAAAVVTKKRRGAFAGKVR